MANTYLTESQVKAQLGITDLRQLSKDKLMNFVSILPNVNDEVAIKIIEQFPEFSKTASTMVDIVRQQCDNILSQNGACVDLSISAYRKILEDFSRMMQLPDISEQQVKYFADKMVEIARYIDAKDTENKQFLAFLADNAGKVALGALGIIGGGFLAYKLYDEYF